MDTLDKSVRTEIVNAVISMVFGDEYARLSKLMDKIQDDHAQEHGCRAFLLDGKPVWNGDAVAAKTKGKKPLREPLRDSARLIVNQMTKIKVDTQRFIQFCVVLEHHCDSYQDYRDALPELVVTHLDYPNIKGLSRTREEGYVFKSNPTKMKVYHSMIDLVLFYLTNRWVF